MKFVMRNAFVAVSDDNKVTARISYKTMTLMWGKKEFLFDIEYLGGGNKFKVYSPSSIKPLSVLGMTNEDDVRDLVVDIFTALKSECVYETE